MTLNRFLELHRDKVRLSLRTGLENQERYGLMADSEKAEYRRKFSFDSSKQQFVPRYISDEN